MYSRVSCASKVETRSNAIRAQAFGESLAGAGAVFPLSDPPGQRRAARNASDSAATSSVDLELPNPTQLFIWDMNPSQISYIDYLLRFAFAVLDQRHRKPPHSSCADTIKTLTVGYPKRMRFSIKDKIVQADFIVVAKDEIEIFEGFGQPKALRR